MFELSARLLQIICSEKVESRPFHAGDTRGLRMRIFTVDLLVLVLLLLSYTGCNHNFAHLDHLKRPQDNDKASPAKIRSYDRGLTDSISKSLPHIFFEAVKANRAEVLGLAALLGLWIQARAYEREKQQGRERITMQDLALLKIARNNLNRIWENHRPGKKVVRMEEFRR